MIGQPQSLFSIAAEEFWTGSVALGAGGAGPWAAASYFRAHGIDCVGSFSPDNLVADISEGCVIVFTTWHPKGWHAMTALYENGEYTVYNRFDNMTEPKIYEALSKVYSNGGWVYGFRIDP